MLSLIEDLLLTLEKQTALYDQVLGFMEQERAALLSQKPQDVLDLVRQKETLLLKIRTLDESRQIICQRLAKSWSITASQVTLREVATRCNTALASHVSAMRYRMTECVDRLRKANDTNTRLCHQGIETIDLIMQAAAISTGNNDPSSAASSAYGRGRRYPADGHNNSNPWTA